jgi:hypothetical protein
LASWYSVCNLALERFGARLWIARIMVTWGLLSAAMALIWSGWSFLDPVGGARAPARARPQPRLFWPPTIVKDFGFSNLRTGFTTATPYLVGAVAVVIWPLLSDRMHERKWNTALAFLVAACGLALGTSKKK